MKKFFGYSSLITLTFVALVLIALPNSVFAQAIASVQQIQGEVFVNKSGSAIDQWTPITQNTDVETGDSVKTKNGSCDLIYTDQAKVHMDSNTSVTLHEEADSQNIMLVLGNLKAQVDKKKALKPFQVVTPTAVGAIRGTDVEFNFNDQGKLTVDLKDGGPVQVFNDEAQMDLNLTDGKKIHVDYDRDKGAIGIQNDPASNGPVEFSILGVNYKLNPGESKDVNLEIATGEPAQTNTQNNGTPENPDDFASPSPKPSSVDDIR